MALAVPARRFVVYSGRESYPLTGDIQATPLSALMRTLSEAHGCPARP